MPKFETTVLRLEWVLEKKHGERPTLEDFKTEPFTGTVDEAKAFLRDKLANEGGQFGQVLRDDGFTLANVCPRGAR